MGTKLKTSFLRPRKYEKYLEPPSPSSSHLYLPREIISSSDASKEHSLIDSINSINKLGI